MVKIYKFYTISCSNQHRMKIISQNDVSLELKETCWSQQPVCFPLKCPSQAGKFVCHLWNNEAHKHSHGSRLTNRTEIGLDSSWPSTCQGVSSVHSRSHIILDLNLEKRAQEFQDGGLVVLFWNDDSEYTGVFAEWRISWLWIHQPRRSLDLWDTMKASQLTRHLERNITQY